MYTSLLFHAAPSCNPASNSNTFPNQAFPRPGLDTQNKPFAHKVQAKRAYYKPPVVVDLRSLTFVGLVDKLL